MAKIVTNLEANVPEVEDEILHMLLDPNSDIVSTSELMEKYVKLYSFVKIARTAMGLSEPVIEFAGDIVSEILAYSKQKREDQKTEEQNTYPKYTTTDYLNKYLKKGE